MHRKLNMAYVFVLLWLLLSGSAKTCFALPGDPLEGRKLLKEKGCIGCHTLWGKGKGVAPDLVKISKGKSIYQLVGGFWNHSPKMMETLTKQKEKIPKFKAGEIENLFTFIYYLNYFDEPGEVESGKRVFQEKKCMQCHSVGTLGGIIGPSFDAFGGVMSPILIAQRMWNHAPTMRKMLLSSGISAPVLSGKEVTDLLTFIRSAAKNGGNEKVYAFSGNPGKGKWVFEKKCARCHSMHGIGGKRAPDLGKLRLRKSVGDIAATMWNHSGKMAQTAARSGIRFPFLAGNDMADLIAYIYFVGFYDAPGDIAKGEKIFSSKKCIQCHSVLEGEKSVGKNLVKSKATHSPFYFAAAMWNHLPEMKGVIETFGLAWPKFENDEMRDMVAYLKSLTPEPPVINRHAPKRKKK